MGEVSPRLAAVIVKFAHAMGLDAMPSADGSYNFVFERSGVLSLTRAERSDRLVVSLSRKSSSLRAADLENHLRMAGFDHSLGRFLHSALDEDDYLVCAFDYHDRELDFQSLDAAVHRLIQIMN